MHITEKYLSFYSNQQNKPINAIVNHKGEYNDFKRRM